MLLSLRKSLAIGLVAVLMLSGVPEVSDVLCISPAGHLAVEQWSAPCCLPGAGNGSQAFSEPSQCAGCTDYSLLPAAEFIHPQPSTWRFVYSGEAAAPVTPFRYDGPAAAGPCCGAPPGPEVPGPQSTTKSLRC